MPRKIEAGPLPAGQLEVNPPFACKGSGACASNGLVERSAKHFTNRDFLAPNVLEIDVDLELLAPLSGVCSDQPWRIMTIGRRKWARGS